MQPPLTRTPDVVEQLRYLYFRRSQIQQAIESLERLKQIRAGRCHIEKAA